MYVNSSAKNSNKLNTVVQMNIHLKSNHQSSTKKNNKGKEEETKCYFSKSSKMTVSGTISLKADTASNSVIKPESESESEIENRLACIVCEKRQQRERKRLVSNTIPVSREEEDPAEARI